MPEITPEEKQKLFEKLPKELRDFMESENTGAFLLYLGGKYKLNDEKVSMLSKLMANIILGITPITSLAQEINLKITSDTQTAMNLAQELYSDLLSPVLKPMPTPAPTPLQKSIPTLVPPAPPAQIPTTKYQIPPADRYREPTTGPEVVDLRKPPPPPMPMPVTPAPIPPKPYMPTSSLPPKPLTFTKPVEPAKPASPLIEAEPHKTPPIANLPRPQYIIRPPGLAPTDLPHDVLDLRRDKGEF